MILISCYIDGFGCYQKAEFNFHKGVNNFCLDNGKGKTTLACFIKSMFYGLTKSRSSDLTKNEYARYLPWNGGAFGGNLTFEVGSEKYKIIRDFSQKDGHFELVELKTNKRSFKWSEDIGEEIFGLSSEGFQYTLFVPQVQTKIKEESSISSMLSKAVESIGDDGAHDLAIKSINESLKQIVKNKNLGELTDCKHRLSVLQREVDVINRTIEDNKHFVLLIDEIKDQIRIKETLKNDLRIEYASALKKESYLEGLNEQKQQQKEMQEAMLFFRNDIPSKEWMDKLDEVYACYSKEQSVLEYKNDEYSRNSGFDKRELIDKTEMYLSCTSKKKRALIRRYIPFVASLCLIILSIPIIINWSSPLGIALLSIGLFMGLVNGYFFFRKKGDAACVSESELGEMYARYGILKGSYQDKLIQINALLEKDEADKAEIAVLRSSLDVREQALRSYLCVYLEPGDYKENVATIQRFYQMYNIYKHLSIPSVDTDREYRASGLINEEIKRNEQSILVKQNELRDAEAAINKLIYLSNELSDKGGQVDALGDRILLMEERKRIYELTLQFINEAKDNLSSKYLGPLTDNFYRYISMFSEEYAKGVNLSTELEIHLQFTGRTRQAEYLSAGWSDILFICLRIALLKTIYPKENSFLILDDTFANLDAANLKVAQGIINTLGKEIQIIYFTCHDSRCL